MDAWSIYIDVEGFSAIYERDHAEALRLLGYLMEGTYRIGLSLPRGTHERLFIHQIGDGFLIVATYPESSLDRPVAIAVGLLQYLLIHRGVGRCGISLGTLKDVRNCYPKMIKDNRDSSGYLALGEGLMSTFPLMGTALVNSYKIQENGTKGPLLFIHPAWEQPGFFAVDAGGTRRRCLENNLSGCEKMRDIAKKL